VRTRDEMIVKYRILNVVNELCWRRVVVIIRFLRPWGRRTWRWS